MDWYLIGKYYFSSTFTFLGGGKYKKGKGKR